ncbi:hypothetical protein CYMTET_20771 [Cymbomonas tetramitiformis]|uniref:Uncharacterized protein n=1 Tax=Cymbomonas tetramitiformis TaxID=36881 RepID=A0AAE0FPH4_9CHLO|nr:hypothetical protein CYMTET_27575 [Cymbomonas tetramitiformis]KAK3270840.1 hypothetical protein CYMTET_20771 [Cymbomonas tetramitiformis]
MTTPRLSVPSANFMRLSALLRCVQYYALLPQALGEFSDSAPRYAFCVAGQIRSFSRTHESIRAELVDKFGDPRAVARDLFLVLDPHCTEVHGRVLGDRQYCDGTLNARVVRRWKRRLRWKDMRVFDVPYNNSESIVPENGCDRDGDGRRIPTRDKYYDSSYYHLHLKQQLCYELVKRSEARVGSTYDWIVSTRPDRSWSHAYTGELDSQFIYTIDDCDVLNKGPLICDAVYVVPRQYADVVYAAKNQIHRCIALDADANETNIGDYPPCHLKEWTSSKCTRSRVCVFYVFF